MNIKFVVEALASTIEGLEKYNIGDVVNIADDIAQLYIDAKWAVQVVEEIIEDVKEDIKGTN